MTAFLFPGNWRQMDDIDVPVIETPLGIVRLDAEIDGSILPVDQANSYTSVSDTRLFVWNSPAARVELILGKVPYEADVTACHAAIWRIRSETQTLTNYILTCKIETAYEGFPSTTEYLDGQEWRDEKVNVTIGTLDPDAMHVYRGKGEMIPDRWTISELDDIANYVRSGFVFNPPALHLGEIGQFQFVVAWAPEPEGHYATQDAVHQSPGYLLSVWTDTKG